MYQVVAVEVTKLYVLKDILSIIKHKPVGPSPHHAFPKCHLLSLFSLAYGCTNLGRYLLERVFKEKSAIKVITVK